MASLGVIAPLLLSQVRHAFDRVNPAASSNSGAPGASGTSDSANPSPSNQLTGNSFIQLLTAQLKAQDPLNPVDPTTFVTQLVQFNQLEQLISINTTLSAAAAPATSGSTPASNSQAAQNLSAAPRRSNPVAGL